MLTMALQMSVGSGARAFLGTAPILCRRSSRCRILLDFV